MGKKRKVIAHHLIARSILGHAHVVLYLDCEADVNSAEAMNDLIHTLPALAGYVKEVKEFPNRIYCLYDFIQANWNGAQSTLYAQQQGQSDYIKKKGL